MTPWSEVRQTQQRVLLCGIVLCVLCAVYAGAVRDGKVFAACLRYARAVVVKADFAGVDWQKFGIGASGFLLLAALTLWAAYACFIAKESAYGEARFATASDLKRMGLTDRKNASGVIVGKVGRKLLSPTCLRHGIALAPTRSGKTAGFVIPTALSFKGSLIIADPKGELEVLLAEPLKKAGKTVYALDWSDERAKDAWNPLSLKVFPSVLSSFGKAERQAERIAAMLVGQKGQSEDHWEANAKKHIAALILFAVYLAEIAEQRLDPNNPATVADYETYREPHLSRVFGFVAKDVDVQTLLSKGAEAVNSAKDNLRDLLRFAAEVGAPQRILTDLASWVNAPDNEAGSHTTTFLSKLQIWRSRAVKGATRECSFEWQDLRETPSVVFIKFPQQDAQSLGVLTALFFETFFGWALDVPKKTNECPIAILADEFASLPKINLMTDFLSKGAGMGAVVWLIVQDFAQIKATYGDKAFETIKTNCSYLLVYAQNNYATQKELAEMVGKATRKRKSVSKSGKSGVSVSENDEGLDLIPVADWGAIPFGRHVLLCQNFLTRPVWCKTPLYFKEKRFTEMLHG